MENRFSSTKYRRMVVWFCVIWLGVITLTALSAVSTQYGFETVLNGGEAGVPHYAWALSFAVMALQVAAWDRVKRSKGWPKRVGALVFAFLLMATSVIFGVGYWAERIDADNFAVDDFTANTSGMQEFSANLLSALGVVGSNLQDLAEESAEKAVVEEREGGTFLGSAPGPGPRMRLRKSDNETLNAHLKGVHGLIESAGIHNAELQGLISSFNPGNVKLAEQSLVRLRAVLNSHVDSPVFVALRDYLSWRIETGKNGLQSNGQLLDVEDQGFENKANAVLTAIEGLPEKVVLTKIFAPGGIESVRLVLNSTIDAIAGVFSFQSLTAEEINADRTQRLPNIQRGESIDAASAYSVDRLAISLGWLIDILIAISVFVSPAWPIRHTYGDPHISRLASVIRHRVDPEQAKLLSGVSDPDLLQVFLGREVGEEILPYLRWGWDGVCQIRIPERDDSAKGQAVTRLAALAAFLPGGSEVIPEQPFIGVRRGVDRWRGLFWKDHEHKLRVVTPLGKTEWIIIGRLGDPDFWDGIDEQKLERASTEASVSVLKLESLAMPGDQPLMNGDDESRDEQST